MSNPATRTPAAGQRRPSAQQFLQAGTVHERHLRASGDHARSSPARRLYVLRLPHERQPRAAATRAAVPPDGSAAPPDGSVYCACHTKVSRGPATQQLLQEALCTAPSTRTPAAGQRRPSAQQFLQAGAVHERHLRASGDHARSSPARRLCILRLPHERQPRAAATRAAAPPGGSVYGSVC